MPDKTTKQSDSLKPVSNTLLSDEEIKLILLTEDDVQELEQTATIGLLPDEHIEYKQRLQWLCDMRLKELTAKAQRDRLISRGWVKPQDIISAELFKAVLNQVGWKSPEEVEALLADERAKTLKEIGEAIYNAYHNHSLTSFSFGAWLRDYIDQLKQGKK